MFWHEHMNMGGWAFMALGNLVIWGLMIAFIIWLVQDWRSRQHHRSTIGGPSAAEILDRRLASGDITTEEHVRVRKTLNQPPA